MKKKGQEFDNRLLPTILRFNTDLDNQLTAKANFIFGASTVVAVFVLNKVLTAEFSFYHGPIKIAWFILLAGSLIASLTSLMIVLPKLRFFSKKERFKNDVFYYKNIMNFYTRDEYCDYLEILPKDYEKSTSAFANQIYSLATTILPFKFKMLKISGWILMLAIIAAVGIIVLSYLVYT